MTDQTPAQRASQEMVDAIFADPDLSVRFKQMASETLNSEPVPDDFSWLSKDAQPPDPPAEFSRFKALTHKLLRVPREEATRVHRRH